MVRFWRCVMAAVAGLALVGSGASWGATGAPAVATCARRTQCDRRILHDTDKKTRDDDKKRGGDDHRDDDKKRGWRQGVTTYYMSYEGGPLGAGGKRLVPFESVAVPLEDFDEMEGRRVEIRGFGTYRVDDGCRGSGCKDFDIFVGDDADEARRLPNWKDGNIDIEYRWLE